MTFKKLNCWEFMWRGGEAGWRNVNHLGICPAYPYHGQECANVVGTFCDLVQVLRTASHAIVRNVHFMTACISTNLLGGLIRFKHYKKRRFR